MAETGFDVSGENTTMQLALLFPEASLQTVASVIDKLYRAMWSM